jgi:hypothetical protein
MLKHWKRTLALLGVVAATGLVCAAVALAKKPAPPPPPPPSGPGLIAFNDAGMGIAVMNPDGAGRTRLATFNALSLSIPAWSHMFSDGTVKVFWRENNSLPLMAADVYPEISDPVAVSDVDVNGGSYPFDVAPSVPRNDGKETVRICYTKRSTNPDGEWRTDIKVVQLIYDPQTGDLTVDSGTAPVVIEAAWGTSYHHAKFSPDGTWIAFEVYDSELGEYSIWVAKSDVSEPPVLVTDAPGSRDTGPTWSPDGSRLAFMSNRDARNPWEDGEIYIASLNPDMSAASIVRKTNSKKIGEAHISWSPPDADGEQISYMHSGGALAIKDYSLGKVMLLTGEQHDLGKGCYPEWSPMHLPKLP